MDNELDDIFGDIEPNHEQIPISPPPRETIPIGPQVIQQIQTVEPPPSEPMQTQEQKEMDKYNEEKKKLLALREQLFRIAHSDKSGSIIRNFDLSQLVISVGNEVDRLNGLVVLRALKARCKSIALIKDDSGNKKQTDINDKEEVVNSMYEVWGIMEDGSVGLTSSYAPSMVLCVISLRSGYDFPPS